MSESSSVSEIAEVNVGIFSFLLNFVWEMWQIPFFANMPTGSHWAGVAICTRATAGDVVISLAAFWAVAARAGTRSWILELKASQVAFFIVAGVLITIILEGLATGPLERWEYASSMPTLPILGTGLLPLLQWLALPPITLWFVRRQLT